MPEIKCQKCLRIPINGALYRQNQKGQKGIFVCISCLNKPVDPELKEVVDAITETNSEAGSSD